MNCRVFYTISSLTFLTLPSLATTEEGIALMYAGKSPEALEKFSTPIQKNDIKACFYASLILLFGDNPKIDRGLELLEKAVHKGYGPALDTYAGLFLHGEFKPQDTQKALMYYEMAARGGYGPSQFNCGILYKNGEKIPKDLEKAFYFLTLAAQNKEDLEDVTEDAVTFRNEVIQQMTQEQYQQALASFTQRKHHWTH